jgi:bifunctional UDP-N-acetylglucosamine pyrophosphorylase / glucosamine-1-phosphate N-acetyltransferase
MTAKIVGTETSRPGVSGAEPASSGRSCLSIILAAGEGTRMRSSRSKVLHEIAGLPLVGHVAKAAVAAGSTALALVVGRDAPLVKSVVEHIAPQTPAFEQVERLGTAHAVLAARPALLQGHDDVLVLFGDTPLVDAEALTKARAALAQGAAVAVMGFRTANPAGYGRLIVEAGRLVAIREHKDATESERRIDFCNGGLMAIDGRKALGLLDAVGNANSKGEYYLTDIVGIAAARGDTVVAIEIPEELVLGVNTRAELARLEQLWQTRRRLELMEAGVSMQDPASVHLAHDTVIEPDVTLEPSVWFGPGVTIGAGATIRAFSHMEGAHVGPGAEVGPFARLRPGAELAARSKVGNFCEVKKSRIGEGAKVNHLTYVGDAVIGARSNIGAGTITCNYDGFNKFKTIIGEDAFIGSNTSLVAPVTIGNGAYIASGSVVTDAVPDDSLAIGRSRQVTKDGRARLLRERFAALKDLAHKN